VFKIAVQGIAGSATRALERAGLGADDVDIVIPHQANGRIIESAARRLGVDSERVFVNIGQLDTPLRRPFRWPSRMPSTPDA